MKTQILASSPIGQESFYLRLKIEDITALRKLADMQRDPAQSAIWFSDYRFATAKQVTDKLWAFLDKPRNGAQHLYRLNAFGFFILAWIDERAHVEIETDAN